MYKSALVAVVAAAGVVSVPATAAASTAQIVIRAVEHQTTFAQQGNAFSFESRLIQNGKLVGHDAVTCYVQGNCYGRFTFNGEGDLFATVPTSQTEAKSFTVKIIGGTRTFTKAHGTVTVTGVSDSVSDLVFRFRT